MHPPLRPVVVRPADPRGVQPPVKREGCDEVVLSRRQPGEADASDANKARLLRNDLHVAERSQHSNKSPRETENRGIGVAEEVLQREATTRMPEIPGDEPGPASR